MDPLLKIKESEAPLVALIMTDPSTLSDADLDTFIQRLQTVKASPQTRKKETKPKKKIQTLDLNDL